MTVQTRVLTPPAKKVNPKATQSLMRVIIAAAATAVWLFGIAYAIIGSVH